MGKRDIAKIEKAAFLLESLQGKYPNLLANHQSAIDRAKQILWDVARQVEQKRK
jgi:hypothetical protein